MDPNKNLIEVKKKALTPVFLPDDSHGRTGELLFAEVEGVIDDGDAVLARVLSRWQISSQDAVVGHAKEGRHGVPQLVVEPHLQ